MQKNYFLAMLLLILPLHNAIAETAEEKGLAIAVEADERDTGWVDQTADLEMVLTNRHGDSSSRTMAFKALEVEGDGDKSLTIFDNPRDIKGTAFLSHTHALKPDDQWLFLPALKRVKRISSANKSGPFVGSEFAYEDLTSQEVEKYSYKWLRDETLDGHEVFVIESYPEYKNSGYTRLISWIDKDLYKVRKVEFYDRKNALLKTLVFTEYNQYLERYWRPGKMAMVNHQTGKKTDLMWKSFQFKNGLGDRSFDRNSLKRAR